MPDSQAAIEKLSTSLSRYQALVVGGLAFIVIFAVSMMGVMLWQAWSLGKQSAKVEDVAEDTHRAVCALYRQNVRTNNDTREILRESPQGFRSPDGVIIIPADLLQRGIEQRQEVIDAFKEAGLSC